MSLEIHDQTKEYEIEMSGATFTLRHWTVDDQEVVDRECIVEDGKDASGLPKFKWNQSRDREIKFERCILGWAGIVMNGQEFIFSPENKKKLPVGIKILLVKEIEERAGLRMTAQEKKT